MGTTIIRTELVAREKVPSLTKLAHVASLCCCENYQERVMNIIICLN